jgi:hypothetical protein
VYKEKCNSFLQAWTLDRYDRKHLQERLEKAKQRNDEAAEKQILAILERKKQQSYWRRLQFKMGMKKGRSMRNVSNEDKAVDV